ncbi:MAG: septal ring lytic transglycosylase RlpA family protein [Pasteurella oralis]|uniref:septal ring lytic transglycosylase RlpA family protein n=1 Tax=Pasteurella oralis TaxID=1071947 RepID=UPI00157DEFDC|nr:septal ring lytic transglycosylase RlpA family protein [Pasteurella oralis]MDO5054650.1 septal ring lytic transglycosylase RlpA family protein [Pasteurella oralis]
MKQKTFQILTALFVALIALSTKAEMTKQLFGLQGPKLTYQQPDTKSYSYWIKGVGYRTQTTNEAKAYSREGIASFYHRKFHGRKTSNGEIYNENLYTAAHKTLPINSYVLVTNLRNNRKVIVRINDRGPFVKGRIIDLSRAAAREIGIIGSGISKVRVEIFSVDQQGKISGPATAALTKLAKNQAVANRLDNSLVSDTATSERLTDKVTSTKRTATDVTAYKIRVLSLDSKQQAESLIARLGRDDLKVEITPNDTKFDIHFGPFSEKSQVDELKTQLRKLNYSKPLIVYTFGN